MARVNEVVREALGDELERLNDPRIGLVTITSLIGKGGYGKFILDGLRRQFPTPTLLGIVLSVGLAVAVDLLFVALSRLATPWLRRPA